MKPMPAWGTAPIRCGKMKCKWRGYETDLASVPHKKFKNAMQSVCPACGCDSYMHMTEREIVTWERSKGDQGASRGEAGSEALTACAAGRDGECGHAQCPQLRDNEPAATGRHCPLDNDSDKN